MIQQSPWRHVLRRRWRDFRSAGGRWRLYASLAAVWREPPRRQFIIFGQTRTGSSLLAQLLRCSPEISCDDEILTHRVRWLDLYIKARSMRHPGKVYGFKMRVDQLASKQRTDPRGFLFAHHRRGDRIIYLRRENIVDQAISGMIAARIGLYRSDRGAYKIRRSKKFRIDCTALLQGVRWREAMLAQEQEALQGVPHTAVVYERDLLNAERHQETLNRLFDYLGVARVPVRAGLVRQSTGRLNDIVENFEEVRDVLETSPYAAFLSDDDRLSRAGTLRS